MDTPYLDDAIARHEQALKINMLSDGGKEALDEFKAIKEALRQCNIVGRRELCLHTERVWTIDPYDQKCFKCVKCGKYGV